MKGKYNADCFYVKQIVEEYGNVGDISVKSRKRELAYLRYLYFKLCRKYLVDVPGVDIAATLDLDHTTVIHGIKQFEFHYGKKYFPNEIYNKCKYHIITVYTDLNKKDYFINLYEIEKYYRIKHINLVNQNHKVINKMQEKINLLNNQLNEK